MCTSPTHTPNICVSNNKSTTTISNSTLTSSNSISIDSHKLLANYVKRSKAECGAMGKGVKHNGRDKHYIDELEKFELINITNDDEFRAKAYAAGLPKSKVCRLLKYKKEIENNGIYKESQC